MTLCYDFDLCPGAEGGTLALFRDRATAEALRGADPDVQAYFIASGFGLNVYHSGYAPGLFPARDLPGRLEVIDRLSANMGVFDLVGRDMNGFDFEAFMTHLEAARAAGESAPAPALALAHPRGTERATAVLGVMFLTMIYLLVWGGGTLAGF